MDIVGPIRQTLGQIHAAGLVRHEGGHLLMCLHIIQGHQLSACCLRSATIQLELRSGKRNHLPGLLVDLNDLQEFLQRNIVQENAGIHSPVIHSIGSCSIHIEVLDRTDPFGDRLLHLMHSVHSVGEAAMRVVRAIHRGSPAFGIRVDRHIRL